MLTRTVAPLVLAGVAVVLASGCGSEPSGGWTVSTDPVALRPPPLPRAPMPAPPRLASGAIQSSSNSYETGPVVVEAAGAAFALWPWTEFTPVRVDADPPGVARLCPARKDGTTPSSRAGGAVSPRWRGGCRPLGSGALELAIADGRGPVTFRVEPVSGDSVELENIHITWESLVDFFVGPEEQYPTTAP